MNQRDYDIVVIGGGIHGAGVTQAAAAAGYSTLMLEKERFAHGTSSRSSKLIHGGLRYLESAQFGLVRESLHERETLLRLAPDLVKRIPFFLPIYRTTRRRPWQVRIGLSIYALFLGLRREARFRRLRREEWESLDGLATTGLRVVFRYWDAQTDDAQLTRAVGHSGARLGARIACPASFVSAERDADGYRVLYRDERGQQAVHCHAMVNASGAWANQVLDHVHPSPPKLEVDLVQGTHLVLPGALTQGVYYTEAPRDGRAVFIMPWYENTLVGTTETVFRGNPDEVRPLPAEADYLRETFRRYFPSRPTEVLESFAGLRVLPTGRGRAFHRRRETIFHPDDPSRPRLLTLYGGKLTAYRATADKALRLLRQSLPVRRRRADTASLRLERAD